MRNGLIATGPCFRREGPPYDTDEFSTGTIVCSCFQFILIFHRPPVHVNIFIIIIVILPLLLLLLLLTYYYCIFHVLKSWILTPKAQVSLLMYIYLAGVGYSNLGYVERDLMCDRGRRTSPLAQHSKEYLHLFRVSTRVITNRR